MTPWRERLSSRFRSLGKSCPAPGPRQTVVTASSIKREVHHELNATRMPLDNIATEFAGCNAVTRPVECRKEGEQSRAVQTAAAPTVGDDP